MTLCGHSVAARDRQLDAGRARSVGFRQNLISMIRIVNKGEHCQMICPAG